MRHTFTHLLPPSSPRAGDEARRAGGLLQGSWAHTFVCDFVCRDDGMKSGLVVLHRGDRGHIRVFFLCVQQQTLSKAMQFH